MRLPAEHAQRKALQVAQIRLAQHQHCVKIAQAKDLAKAARITLVRRVLAEGLAAAAPLAVPMEPGLQAGVALDFVRTFAQMEEPPHLIVVVVAWQVAWRSDAIINLSTTVARTKQIALAVAIVTTKQVRAYARLILGRRTIGNVVMYHSTVLDGQNIGGLMMNAVI